MILMNIVHVAVAFVSSWAERRVAVVLLREQSRGHLGRNFGKSKLAPDRRWRQQGQPRAATPVNGYDGGGSSAAMVNISAV